ncbi:MAG TPA: hypothetical protein VIU46_04100 [Gallionellaceae bacterium]
MMNPEFKRNLWLSFSTHKLIAMPALLTLGALALAMSDKFSDRTADNLYTAAVSAFIFIVWLWGARNANLSIVDELRDKTWDQQRMSALNPWAMTWGKLFGSTSFNWYGGAICLAIAIPAGIIAGDKAWMLDLPAFVATGIMLHATLIALNLHTGQMEMQLIQRGGLGWIVIIFTLISFNIFTDVFIIEHDITWWGIQAPGKLVLLYSTVLFGICAVFSAWRVVSNALQVRTIPWAWPLFALILTAYFSGFSASASEYPVFVISRIGLVITAVMTYGTLFSEPARLPDWNMLRLRQQRNDWRGWLQNLPLWPTTLLLAFCFALLGSLPADNPQTGLGLIYEPFLALPVGFAFMLLRDAGIVLFFSFSPKSKRPGSVALLYLIVLDALLPFFFKVAGLDAVSYFLLPLGNKYGAAVGVMAMATQAIIALGLVAWRLQQSKLAEAA